MPDPAPTCRRRGTDPAAHRRLGQLLCAARARRGLRQRDVAALLGTSYQQVHKYERGQTALPVTLLPALIEHLGLGLDELLEAVRGGALPEPAPGRVALPLWRAASRLAPARQSALARFLEEIV